MAAAAVAAATTTDDAEHDDTGVWMPELRAAFRAWVEGTVGFGPDTAEGVAREMAAVLQVRFCDEIPCQCVRARLIETLRLPTAAGGGLLR